MSKGQLTRSAVLDQAARTASEVGLRGVTIGTLADLTHMSKSGLFAHFGSKESLQLATIQHARERFVDVVIRPALTSPRGEPRVRALFERWLEWATSELPGGCLFVAAAAEFDDVPGQVHDDLVRSQLELVDMIARVFRSWASCSASTISAGCSPTRSPYNAPGVPSTRFSMPPGPDRSQP
jgi:AcrR family transcriptional regulator